MPRGATLLCMHACAMRVELRVPGSRSLKEKRRALRPIVDRLRHRLRVSVAEVGHQDLHQRAALGVALVADSSSRLDEMVDTVERLLHCADDVEVMAVQHGWMAVDDEDAWEWT